MNGLSLIVERYGKVGVIERLLPEIITPIDDDGQRLSSWSHAVGILKIKTIADMSGKLAMTNEMLASIVIMSQEGKKTDIMEFHGVMFFKPLDGVRWEDQPRSLKTSPNMFEVVPIAGLRPGRSYAFFAARVSVSERNERKPLS